MDNYTLMRLAEEMDDDAVEPEEILQMRREEEEQTRGFAEKYRSFYDDVKISPKEDW